MENTTFYNKCKGLALVFSTLALLITGTLLGTAALLHSASPAQAHTPTTMYATGKYQMSISAVVDENGATWWYIIVWDSETGRSKYYYGSVKEGTKTAASKFQLPSSPL